MRIVTLSGYAFVSDPGSTGSAALVEIHGSRQAGIRTREWPLDRSSMLYGEASQDLPHWRMSLSSHTK